MSFFFDDCFFCGNPFLAAASDSRHGFCVCKSCQREHDDGNDRLFYEMARLAGEVA